MLKSTCFSDFDFSALFRDFYRFWLDFGRPWALQKFKKITQDAPKVDFGMCLGRILFPRWVWEGFWEDLGRILSVFQKDFERMFISFLKGFGYDFTHF